MFYNNTVFCSSPCGTNKQCTAPNNCTCVIGWMSSDCLTCMFVYTIELIIQSYNNTAICNFSCGIKKQCTAPNNCTCMDGWTGSDCLTCIFVYTIEIIMNVL